MCGYSLEQERNRKARENETLRLRTFSRGSHGFASPHDASTAVCLIQGTKLMVCGVPASYPHADQIKGGVMATFSEKPSPYGTPGQYYKDALLFEGADEPVLLQNLPEGFLVQVCEIPAEIAEVEPELELVGAD